MWKQIAVSLLISWVIVMIASASFFYVSGSQAANAIHKMPLDEQPADGQYEGVFYTFKKFPAASVRFTIFEGQLVNFNIMRVLSMPPHHPRTEILSAAGNQGLHFDAVSGATISSRLVQAAIASAELRIE